MCCISTLTLILLFGCTGRILLKFQEESQGSRFGLKDRENARTKRGHAERFVTYMAAGEDEILGLRYLYNLEKLQV